ncbi:hypothetical protein [Streptomyces venezuelae]|uniref:hypothetical protein n=1 Tax=Streptomyces venezuelae TaxID=54571 RepID=UPI00123B9EFB|nr:hypothetical protein [Streptomyces venezuelae]
MLAQHRHGQGAGEGRPGLREQSGTAQPVLQRLPAAAPVVQRVLEGLDPAAATRRMEQQGWRRTADGGWTRGPVPEVGESADGLRPDARTEEPEQEQAAGEDPAITLRVLVKKSASFRDADYFQRVGHSWVAFYKDDKFQASAGFYPKGGINEDAPHRSVPGEVRLNYDDPNNATTVLSVPITAKQYKKAKNYIKDNLNHDYNLLTYNCTDFAINVHKAATGHRPPGSNLLMPNNPNDLHSGIKKHNTNQD